MTGLSVRLKGRREALDHWLARNGRASRLSLAKACLFDHTLRLIEKKAAGQCLDVGAGRSPFRAAMLEKGARVISIDLEDRDGALTYIADVQNLSPIDDASIDLALCTQVLEHVPRPCRAVEELARVLRPGGYLILTVPHLSAIHEAPHDYYRYTEFGLRALLSQNGFVVEEVTPTSGLVAFLAHPVSWLLLTLTVSLPGVRQVAWALNDIFLIRLLSMIDRRLGACNVYPCDYIVGAQRERAAP